MNLIVVYNPKSGGEFTKKSLAVLFKKNELNVLVWIPIDELQEKLPRHIKSKKEKGAVIAAIGGDGTVSAVSGFLADTSAILAPLPGGTLNHFTKDLGVDQNIDAAVARLKKAKVHSVDVAEVNNQLFINNSSIGLYPTSLRTRDRLEGKFGKWPSALFAALRAAVRLRLFTVTIRKETFRTPFVFVGNNTYALDMINTPTRRKLDSGKLSVFVAKTGSRRRLLKIALFALVGKARYLDEFDYYEIQELTIKMKRHYTHVSCDGEVIKLKTPLTYSIHKKSLKVLC